MDPLEKALLAVLLLIVTAIFGRQYYAGKESREQRAKSANKLGEAEDTVGRDYVGTIEQREKAAVAKMEEARAELAKARDEIVGMKIRGAARDVKVKVLMAHVLKLTRIVVEKDPTQAQWARESALMDMFDESQRDRP